MHSFEIFKLKDTHNANHNAQVANYSQCSRTKPDDNGICLNYIEIGGAAEWEKVFFVYLRCTTIGVVCEFRSSFYQLQNIQFEGLCSLWARSYTPMKTTQFPKFVICNSTEFVDCSRTHFRKNNRATKTRAKKNCSMFWLWPLAKPDPWNWKQRKKGSSRVLFISIIIITRHNDDKNGHVECKCVPTDLG